MQDKQFVPGGGGGFHHRPTFAEVVEACEHLGRDRKKAQSGVNIFFFSLFQAKT